MIMVWFYKQSKLTAMVPEEMHSMEQVLLLLVFPIVVLEPMRVAEHIHQVEFVVVEEQQQW